MWTAIKMLFDKNFGWRFKFANLIMADYLRNYLAVGVCLPLDNAKKYYKHENECKQQIDKARETVYELFEM